MFLPQMGQFRNAIIFSSWIIGISAVGGETPTTCPSAPNSDAKTLRRLARTAQPDRGFLWEISKNGRRSFLYGTVHVAKLEWDFPGPTIKAALNASQQVAVELDLTDPALAKRLNEQGRELAEKSRTWLAPAKLENLAERLRVQFRRACLDEAGFGDATLGSKATSLSLLSARDEGLYPEQAIDAALVGFARATGKNVIELETPGEQAYALGGDPESVEREIERLESGEARTELIKLTSAWAAGDFPVIEGYFSWCHCAQDQAEIRRQLGDRNAVLAERLAYTYETQEGVFAAIGVLHMIGPESVVERLRSLGYSVLQSTTLSAKP
jgi:uncharacterized protein YbaP (TraB family)